MARVTERQAPAPKEPEVGRAEGRSGSAEPGLETAAKKPSGRRAKATTAAEGVGAGVGAGAQSALSEDFSVDDAELDDNAHQASFDRFVAEQRAALVAERAALLDAAAELQAEADSLAADAEPGDIQFDDESGEGGTTTIDRERDLLLSAQARVQVQEIDEALERIERGTYGICESCGQRIPRARLRAMPSARLCVACKSGGLSRR
jgi:DnaK suppressor protein